MIERPFSAKVPRGHLPALDGLRGLAALMVVVMHTTVVPGPSLLDRVVHRVGTLGWIGVDLFFVLSGFLITGILADARLGRGSMRNFYVRRILRIWPLYLAFLAFCFVVVPAITGLRIGTGTVSPLETVAYWLHLGNVVPAVRGFVPGGWLDVTWSLAVEEQFYMIWPAIIVFSSRRTAMRVAAGAVVAAPLFRLALVGLGSSPVTIYVLTPARMDALAAGSWVALAARGPAGLAGLRPAAGRVLIGAMLGLLVLLSSLVAGRRGWYPFEIPMHTLGFTLLAAFFTAALVRLVTAPPHALARRLLAHPLPRAFGKYSYAIYLIHTPVRDVLYLALGWSAGTAPALLGSAIPAQVLVYSAVTVTTFAFAWLSWHLYENHFLHLKRFFPTDGADPAVMRPTRIRRDAAASPRLAAMA